MGNYVDLSGRKINNLLVLHRIYDGVLPVKFLCKCDCGNELIVESKHLDGTQKSCRECAIKRHTDHGMSKSSEHSIWRSILGRCYNKNNQAYDRYGGRGISVDDAWLGENGFVNFYNDMGARPSKDYSIDRRNNDKGYSKENCRWATRMEQSRNRRNNIYVIYKGERKLLKEVVAEVGISYKLVHKRHIINGWSLEKSLIPPIK